jgi:glycosyltransferase involved in cell wall biosynthesis
MNCDVSVVIRAHGEACFLNKTIESLRNQTNLKQIVIVLDKPSDNLVQNLESYLVKSDIKLVNLDYANLSRALNLGLLNTNNNLVAIIDGDDTMNLNRLKIQADFLSENKNIPVVGSNFFQIDSKDQIIKRVEMPKFLDRGSFINWKFCPIAHSSVMFKKDIIMDFGGYNEKYEFAEDYDLWIRINKYFAMYNLPEFLTNYRVHQAQTTSSNFLKMSKVKVAVDIENGLSLRKKRLELQLLDSVDLFYNRNVYNLFLWRKVTIEFVLHKINYFINNRKLYITFFYRLTLVLFAPKKMLKKKDF